MLSDGNQRGHSANRPGQLLIGEKASHPRLSCELLSRTLNPTRISERQLHFLKPLTSDRPAGVFLYRPLQQLEGLPVRL